MGLGIVMRSGKEAGIFGRLNMSSKNLLFAEALVLALVITTSALPPPPPPRTIPVTITEPTSISVLGRSNQSALYEMLLPQNASYLNGYPPYVLRLNGTRYQIGYDYAALFAQQTSYSVETFLNTVTNNVTEQGLLLNFTAYLWTEFYLPHIPGGFLRELQGMKQWFLDHPDTPNVTMPPHEAAMHFYVFANMPADAKNIIAALEAEFEVGWPVWLKDLVNGIIDVLEKLAHHCDAYGVWGSRTVAGQLYTSRNLDYVANSGINRYKLVILYNIFDEEDGTRCISYASIGFSFGMGALAGMNVAGVTVSEMNIDNSDVTFSGLPFPLRLRYVLERASSLEGAMTIWNSTNNTNSFNFLIGSSSDGQAFALETIENFTAVFPANSPVERAAYFPCGIPPDEVHSCLGWTNETGNVTIGFPLPEAVWRTNHALHPRIMATQESLYNDTVFRYNALHRLIQGFGEAQVLIGDQEAVGLVASLGTYGCENIPLEAGGNVMSIAYVPAQQRFFVSWEDGSQATWRMAACAPYVKVNLAELLALP